MSVDLSNLSLSELEKVAEEIRNRKKEIEKGALRQAYAKVLEIAKEHGVTVEDVIALHSGKGSHGIPKYANPEDPLQTWSGRGRKPGWFVAALNAGLSPADLEL